MPAKKMTPGLWPELCNTFAHAQLTVVQWYSFTIPLTKAEGSTGRGSSVIRGACDLAFLHSLDKESGQIRLKIDKNRFGPSRTITIRCDFEGGIRDD